MSAVAQPQPQTQIIEGFIYDVETGEFIGVAEKPRFSVVDQGSAEWVLEKMQTLDAEIAALEARKLALVTNMDAMIADAKRHRSGMEWRFGPEIAEVAKANLPHGKKSWTCPYGTVQFRTVKGGLKVKDAALAIEAAKAYGFTHALKVSESFLISQLTDTQKYVIEVDALRDESPTDDVRISAAFEVTEDRETVSIKSGVEK